MGCLLYPRSEGRRAASPPGGLSAPACLPAALLYKPVDRVTRSTLVLHVSPWGPGPPRPGALGFCCPGADAAVCQLCPPAPLSALRLY